MKRDLVSPVLGWAAILLASALVAVALGLFRGSFTPTAPITVLSPRAGLVMNVDARVKMRGVEVGKVDSIEALPDGQAALHLAMDPAQLQLIPANVLIDIASTTVFGAKYVQLMPPADPSPQPLHAGAVLDARHVTVEINTVFQQLTALLAKIEPDKLNETLGAIASALHGRGPKLGQALSDLDKFFATVDPSLPALRHDLAVAPAVLDAYADAAPDLIKTAANATRISQTILDEQQNLDALLLSAIGVADIGHNVLATNRQPLTDALAILVPTTDLTNEYHAALTCGLGGIVPLQTGPPSPVPGQVNTTSFVLGVERYRYPKDLPKVAATGGPQCTDLPNVPYGKRVPFVVTDNGSNPWQYGNQGILLNSNRLKQWLFGPIDGPARNTGQVGQPG
jgi:phospholipid/cholesterol/gamma-HCH transport system substrate-binding protein